MKRIFLLAAAALGSGCVSSSAPPPAYGDYVIVYSTFQHYDYTGTFQPLTCAQAGVDTVRYDFSDGYYETHACTDLGQPIPGFAPGAWWVTVTGYRNGVAVALYYSGGVNFTKYAGTDAVVYADVQGIPGNLELFPTLNVWTGTAYVPYASPACQNGSVDILTYAVRDGAGITLAQGQVNCATDPPSILFSGQSAIDKDDLAIRMQAWQGAILAMDSCTVSFPHFGDNDVGLAGAGIDLFDPIPSPCL